MIAARRPQNGVAPPMPVPASAVMTPELDEPAVEVLLELLLLEPEELLELPVEELDELLELLELLLVVVDVVVVVNGTHLPDPLQTPPEHGVLGGESKYMQAGVQVVTSLHSIEGQVHGRQLPAPSHMPGLVPKRQDAPVSAVY